VRVAEDARTLSASQYALLIISEAAKRLGDDAEVLRPGRLRRDIRGTGNHPRRAYDNLDAVLIWKVFHEHLPALKAAVSAALERLVAAIVLNANFLGARLTGRTDADRPSIRLSQFKFLR
jgi:uncharacterized protein with HEPN domain